MQPKISKTFIPNPFLPVFLVVILLLPLISACQMDTNPSRTQASNSVTGKPKRTSSPSATPRPTRTATATPKPTSRLKVAPEDLEGIDLQYWHTWTGQAGNVMASLIDEFNRSNQWGITVNASMLNSPDEIQEQMGLAIEEGSPPDIAVAYLYQATAWDGEPLLELDDYVDDPIWGFTSEEKDDFFPIFWNHDKLGGNRMGIPAHRSAQMLYYNSTWAEELGFSSPPSTPAQFRQQACAAARAVKEDENLDNDSGGGWIISNNYAAVLGWLFAFEGQVTDSKGEDYLFDTPEVEEAFGFLRKLFEEGCAWLPETELGDVPEYEFANRLGLFSTGSLTDIPHQEDAFADAKSVDEWTVVPFPSYDNQATITIYGPSYFILKSTPEKQLASWLLIQWLASAENQARLIKASNGFPLRASVLELIDEGAPPLNQWSKAVDMLPQGKAEPNLPSWRTVRWTVNDVATQLYRWYFTMEQLPATIKLLDKTANELHTQDQSGNE